VESIRCEKVLNLANALTIIRILLLPAIVWRFCRGDMYGALAIYLAAMLTDVADGFAARKLRQITALGKLLDPLADKLSLLTLLGLFSAAGQIPAWILAIVVLKEIILIVGSYAALREGIVVYALPIGKLTTLAFVLSMTARFLGYGFAADILLGAFVLLSLAALVWYSIVLMDKRELEDAAVS